MLCFYWYMYLTLPFSTRPPPTLFYERSTSIHDVMHLSSPSIIRSTDTYPIRFSTAEDNMNIQLKEITVTTRDGRVSQLDQVYIRGSSVRFFIVPDMLKNAPMFKRATPGAMKGRGLGLGRGTAMIRGKAGTRCVRVCSAKIETDALLFARWPWWSRRWFPWWPRSWSFSWWILVSVNPSSYSTVCWSIYTHTHSLSFSLSRTYITLYTSIKETPPLTTIVSSN